MDKQTERINGILFDVFGLCPDYRVVWTDKEWFEFYEPIFPRPFDKYEDRIYPNMQRLHITEHQTKLDSGIVVSAKFIVHHQSRTIYLQVVDIGGNRIWSMYKNG